MKLKQIILFISIFIISGIFTAIYVITTLNKEENNSPQEINTEIEQLPDYDTEVDINTNIPLENDSEISDTSSTEKPLEFTMPVNSKEIGMNFSDGQLIYSKTLNEWRTHNGIDILAKCGTPVFAAEDGIIKEIESSSNDGIKIIIEHKDGYTSVYSNLSTTKMVNLKEMVKKGQVISGIGKTSAFEYHEPEHLHFEMYKDGLLINPLSVIK